MSLLKLFFSKTAVNTYIIFSGNFLSAFLAFVFTVLYVRVLDLSDVGYFAALISMLLLVSDLGDMGVGMSLATFLPRLEESKTKLINFLKSSFFLQVCIALIITVPIFIFSEAFSSLLFHTRELSAFIKITSVGIFFIIISNFSQYALSARQKFFKASVILSSGGILRVALLLLLIIGGAVTLSNLVYIQTLSLLFLLFLALPLLGFDLFNKEYRINKHDIRKLIKFSYLIGLARGFTTVASKLDVLMIIALRNPTEAGIYSLASRVIAIFPLLTGSFTTVIAPRISKTREKKTLVNFLFKVILATTGLITGIVALIMLARPFMVLLFAEKGALAVTVFQLLLFSMVFFVSSIPAVSLAVYFLKKPQVLTFNSILQVVIVVLGNFIFIPRFGGFGAAYSLIIAYGVTLVTTTLMTLYFYRKHHP